MATRCPSKSMNRSSLSDSRLALSASHFILFLSNPSAFFQSSACCCNTFSTNSFAIPSPPIHFCPFCLVYFRNIFSFLLWWCSGPVSWCSILVDWCSGPAGWSVSQSCQLVMQPCLLACHSCCSLMWGSCFLLGFLPFSIVSMLELAILKEASHATSILRL